MQSFNEKTRRNFDRHIVAFAIFALAAPLGARQPNPADDLKALIAAPGFEINLFAADPAIAKPIQMNFDHRGRLWVVSSESYPQLKPGDKPADKVFVLEDSDGDGKADKTTQFAGGLMIPTGIEIGPTGAYVGQSTEMVRIDRQRTSGAPLGGKPQTVLSGFGTEDTHHLIHSFRWSPDGWLFFGQSIYIHSHVETPWGVKRLNGGGFWMFRPESHRLEVFVHGMVNSWGIAWNEFGQAFGVDNHDGPSGTPIKWFLPGTRFEFTPNEADVLLGIVKDKPKYCGAEFVVGNQFPPEFQGNFITCDFRAHRVVRYRMDDDGSGFKAVELEPLVKSLNPNFRPVDVKMGPDGALYICDWYNPIINHGEVDFRDPRRDKLHGRIWRVTAKGRPMDQRPRFDELTVEQLIERQGSSNGWTRQFSRRALVERNSDEVARRVADWIRSSNSSDERRLLAAIWTTEAVHRTNARLIERGLRASDARVRAEVVRIAGLHPELGPQIANAAVQRVSDPHPHVRVAAIRSLATSTDVAAIKQALLAKGNSTDRFLDYASRLLARETANLWLPILERELSASDEPDDGRWLNPLLAVDRSETVGPLLTLLRRKLIPASGQSAVLSAIARRGDPANLRAVLDRLVAMNGEPLEARIPLAEALVDAARLRGIVPAGDLKEAVASLLDPAKPALSTLAIRMIGLWRLQSLKANLLDLANRSDVVDPVRTAAMAALPSLGGSDAAESLARIATPRAAGTAKELTIRQTALAALAELDAEKAAKIAAETLANDLDAAALTPVASLIRLKPGAQALAKAVAGKKLKPDVARAAIATVNASGQLLPELLAILGKAGGLPADSVGPSQQGLVRLASLAVKSGDSGRGREIYRREKLQCVKCHRIGTEGGEVGPALTTIGTSAPVDYLVESLLWPDRKVKENYHSMIVTLTTGEVVTGIPVRKTPAEIVLRNAENKLISIPTRDVEASRVGGSIMPAGLVESLSENELADLVRYLSDLGKPTGAANLARRWLMLGPYSVERAAEIESTLFAKSDSHDLHWQPTWTTNDGWVYIREFALKPQVPILFAVAEIEVKTSGKFRLSLRPADARVWLDGKSIAFPARSGQDSQLETALTAGRHRFTFRIDVLSRASQLRLETTALEPQANAEFVEPIP